MSAADVDVKFAADLEEIKKNLEELNHYFHGWSHQIKEFGEHAFEWGLEHLKEGLHELYHELHEIIEVAAHNEEIDRRLELAVKGAGFGFAATADDLKELAENLALTNTFSAENIKQAETMALRWHLNAKMFGEVMEAAANLAAAQGGDLTDSTKKLGVAMNLIEKGNATRVFRILKMELADLSRAESEHIKALTKAGQVEEAQQLILEAVKNKYKDAAEVMSHTYLGRMKQLSNVVEEVKVKIGTGFLPLMEAMIEPLKEIAIHVEDVAAEFEHWLVHLSTGSDAQGFIESVGNMLKDIAANTETFFRRIPVMIDIVLAHVKAAFAELRRNIDDLVSELPAWLVGDTAVKAQNRLGMNLTDAQRAEYNALQDKGDYKGAEKYARNLGATDIADQLKANMGVRDAWQAWNNRGTWGDETSKYRKEIDEAAAKHKEELEEKKKEIEEKQKEREGYLAPLRAASKFFDWASGGGTFDEKFTDKKEKQDQYDEANPILKGLFKYGEFLGRGFDATTKKQWDDAAKDVAKRFPKQEKEEKPFKSAIEDATSVFNRIQLGLASDPDTPEKKQVDLQGEIVRNIVDKISKDDAAQQVNKAIWEQIRDNTAKNSVARAG